jgi:hypothetical protein
VEGGCDRASGAEEAADGTCVVRVVVQLADETAQLLAFAAAAVLFCLGGLLISGLRR